MTWLSALVWGLIIVIWGGGGLVAWVLLYAYGERERDQRERPDPPDRRV